mmetsp:Transcript_8498/g.53096  ORF Transcript_8498/g.53096 Transcript_8498/m.53096 type:complete len:126 (+) Transcript_8498:1077-1454(+)
MYREGVKADPCIHTAAIYQTRSPSARPSSTVRGVGNAALPSERRVVLKSAKQFETGLVVLAILIVNSGLLKGSCTSSTCNPAGKKHGKNRRTPRPTTGKERRHVLLICSICLTKCTIMFRMHAKR